jgi:superfamily II DNA or RNA helicase
LIATESLSASLSAISSLKFPFELTKDQIEAVDAWTTNGYRGSIIYSTGTGKTEIAFECAKKAAERDHNSSFNILFLVPRIVLVQQNINRLSISFRSI